MSGNFIVNFDLSEKIGTMDKAKEPKKRPSSYWLNDRDWYKPSNDYYGLHNNNDCSGYYGKPSNDCEYDSDIENYDNVIQEGQDFYEEYGDDSCEEG